MNNLAVYGESERGNKTLIYKGYEYWKKKVLAQGHVVWRCCKHQTLKCKAVVITNDLVVVKNINPEHSHEGNNSTGLARRAVGEMKRKAVENLATPASTRCTVSSTLPDHVLMALPQKNLIARTLRRSRHKHLNTTGNVLPAAPTDTHFIMPAKFTDFVLFDSGPGDDRMIMFGCNEMLDGLARASLWLADGTFKVVPAIFFQLYTIHFAFVDGISPVGVYILVKNKTRATYDRILNELLRLIPTAAPQRILTDFEVAAMGAFGQRFPLAQVSGCYFHLTQSVLRKVNEVGLKVDYETRDDVRGTIRCLAALSHVPPDDVAAAFDLLSDEMPQVEHLDEVYTYFKHTYIRGRRLPGRGGHRPALFPIDVWNQMEAAGAGMARTNNICEGWHHALQSLLQCSHPNLWRFLDGLHKDSIQQRASFLQGVTGIHHQSQKKYRTLLDRVRRAVATYGNTHVLIYLRAIAHLSYS